MDTIINKQSETNKQLEYQKYFSENIIEVQDLQHRGNNILYKIQTKQGNYLLKLYSTFQKDGWNRGKTEFCAFEKLWALNFHEIPKPIASYNNYDIGIYSFEEGKNLLVSEIKKENIIVASKFLAKLHSIPDEEKIKFPAERTACFKPIDYLKLIDNRIGIIGKYEPKNNEGLEYRRLLDETIIPKIEKLKRNFITTNQDKLEKELTLEEQVVTPGDFGFHNILVNGNKHVFLDFEYCGRDDPVKQILDFKHHDRTREISQELKDLFFSTYITNTNSSKEFFTRLNKVNDIIAMNWVLIYLNVLSENYQKHLNTIDKNIEKIISERVEKAKNKLETIIV